MKVGSKEKFMSLINFTFLLLLATLVTKPLCLWASPLPLDNKKISLEGLLKSETVMGPPGYGENPESDSKETIYLLNVPPQSVNVQTIDPLSGKALITSYDRFQIVISPETIKTLPPLLNQKVIIKGALFEASSGHHHTPILIDADSIELKKSSQP